MALANPAGLQFDFALKVFGLWFLAGIFFLLAAYGVFTWRHFQKISRKGLGHQSELSRLQKQLHIQKMRAATDQEFLSLFVAYLEKFHTTSSAHSLSTLLAGAKFSDNEIAELKVVNYGKGKLSAQLKEKIMKRIKE